MRTIAGLTLLLAMACSDTSDSPVVTTTTRSDAVTTAPPAARVGDSGIEVETPSGWSVESSSSDTLYLHDGSGSELRIQVQPTPAEPLPADEVLRTLSAFGDESAVITDVEGGYVLYAALDCPAEPCERVVAFAYNLSLEELTDLGSRLTALG